MPCTVHTRHSRKPTQNHLFQAGEHSTRRASASKPGVQPKALTQKHRQPASESILFCSVMTERPGTTSCKPVGHRCAALSCGAPEKGIKVLHHAGTEAGKDLEGPAYWVGVFLRFFTWRELLLCSTRTDKVGKDASDELLSERHERHCEQSRPSTQSLNGFAPRKAWQTVLSLATITQRDHPGAYRSALAFAGRTKHHALEPHRVKGATICCSAVRCLPERHPGSPSCENRGG